MIDSDPFNETEEGDTLSATSADGLLAKPSSMEEGDTLNASLLDEECPESGALSVYSLVKLNAFIVGWSAGHLLVVSLPKQVLDIVGDARKGSSLGRIHDIWGRCGITTAAARRSLLDRFKGFLV